MKFSQIWIILFILQPLFIQGALLNKKKIRTKRKLATNEVTIRGNATKIEYLLDNSQNTDAEVSKRRFGRQ
jgi:uncharacterized protein YxjI